MQTQTVEPTTEPIRENFFDENGNTVENVAAEPPEPDPIAEEARAAAAAEAAQPAEPPKKYRIGDREFATQEDAIAYAAQRDSEIELTNAYSQGLKEGLQRAGQTQPGVTPPIEPLKPKFNTEELYTNPDAFLQKFADQIKADTRAELTQTEQLKAQSDAIWREFADRHPQLADFRSEVENFVQQNQTDVRALIQTKGRPASYDFIATKLKSRFESYASAIKPVRELPNNKTGASPTKQASGVTPPEPAKKSSTMSEQVRSIRRKR